MKNKINRRKIRNRCIFLYKFPRYKQVQAYLKLLANEYPKRVKYEHIGRTIRGRQIDMVVIAKSLKNKKDAVLIDAGIHGREWITITSALCLIEHLVKSPKLLSYMDFYIIPCLNPDGYEYSHIADRMWRKNLNTNKSYSVKSFGVDINRNFPYKYGDPKGSSRQPKSMRYRGECALSEPESLALAGIFRNLQRRLKLYVSLHSYGNLILYPWGYSKVSLWDKDDLLCCGQACKAAMKRCGINRKYKVGSIASLMCNLLFLNPTLLTNPKGLIVSSHLDVTSGCTVDYARGCHGVKFSYTIELEKGGNTGFNPAPSKILQIGSELICGIGAMVRYVYKYYEIRDSRRAHCNRDHNLIL